MDAFANMLLLIGVWLAAIATAAKLLERLGVGRLPGDGVLRDRDFGFCSPIGLALLLSLVFALYSRLPAAM
jgi:hypothetical protein